MNKKRNLFLLVPLVFCLTSFCSNEISKDHYNSDDYRGIFRTKKNHPIKEMTRITDEIASEVGKIVYVNSSYLPVRILKGPFVLVKNLVFGKSVPKEYNENQTKETLILEDNFFNLIGEEKYWKIIQKNWIKADENCIKANKNWIKVNKKRKKVNKKRKKVNKKRKKVIDSFSGSECLLSKCLLSDLVVDEILFKKMKKINLSNEESENKKFYPWINELKVLKKFNSDVLLKKINKDRFNFLTLFYNNINGFCSRQDEIFKNAEEKYKESKDESSEDESSEDESSEDDYENIVGDGNDDALFKNI